MTAPMSRKAFVRVMGGSTIALLFQACGGGGGDSGTPAPAPVPAPAPAGGPTSCGDTIEANHGHVLTVDTADLNSATDKVYNIQGAATHNHTVTLTVAQLATLKAGLNVNVLTSTTELHQHTVSILCA